MCIRDRFRDVAQAMGVQVEGISVTCAAEKAIEAIKKLSRQLEIPSDLKQLGVKEEDFAVMADNAKKDVCQLTNPRTATREPVSYTHLDVYKRQDSYHSSRRWRALVKSSPLVSTDLGKESWSFLRLSKSLLHEAFNSCSMPCSTRWEISGMAGAAG